MTLGGIISNYRVLRLLYTVYCFGNCSQEGISNKNISVMIHETAGVKAGTYNFVGSSALFSCSMLKNLIDNYSLL